jgi:hypothetical protein
MSRTARFVHRFRFAETGPDHERPGDGERARIGKVGHDSRPIPERGFPRRLHELHAGKCPLCKGDGPVDLHRSYLAWSILLVPFWSRMSQVCCRSCGTRLQLGGIVFSALLGLLGIPFCWIIPPLIQSRGGGFVNVEVWGMVLGVSLTPLGLIYALNKINFAIQVLRNLRGIALGPDPRTPSAALEELARSGGGAVASLRARRPSRRPHRAGSPAFDDPASFSVRFMHG